MDRCIESYHENRSFLLSYLVAVSWQPPIDNVHLNISDRLPLSDSFTPVMTQVESAPESLAIVRRFTLFPPQGTPREVTGHCRREELRDMTRGNNLGDAYTVHGAEGE